jgi:hypothetical protein
MTKSEALKEADRLRARLNALRSVAKAWRRYSTTGIPGASVYTACADRVEQELVEV